MFAFYLSYFFCTTFKHKHIFSKAQHGPFLLFHLDINVPRVVFRKMCYSFEWEVFCVLGSLNVTLHLFQWQNLLMVVGAGSEIKTCCKRRGKRDEKALNQMWWCHYTLKMVIADEAFCWRSREHLGLDFAAFWQNSGYLGSFFTNG